MNKIAFKHNAFTFVELLMVMLILGIIITLTMPLLQNIKNDDELYRSYMKKAIHDVTDATSLVFLRERYLTDFTSNSLDNLCLIYGDNNGHCVNNTKYAGCTTQTTCADSTGLRALYNLLAVPGTTCGAGNDCFTAPITDMTPANITPEGTIFPGIQIGNKSVMQFQYDPKPAANPTRYGNIYIDINGNKKPNTACQDRYRFILYKDRAVMDTTYGPSCNFAL